MLPGIASVKEQDELTSVPAGNTLAL
jgi:hypothetical protein